MRRRFTPKDAGLSREQQALWQRLNVYIRNNEGWIVSEPDIRQIRFECKQDSSLPELLKSAGHDVLFLGTHERLTPSTIVERRGSQTFTNQVVAPGVVNVWTFDLPTEKPDG